MCARSILLLGIILDMRLCGVSICTVEVRRPAALALYVSFVITVFHRSSQHGTSTIDMHMLAKSHNAKWNELTEWEVSELKITTIDETALAMQKRQGSWGITIASCQGNSYSTVTSYLDKYNWQTKHSKLVAKHFVTAEVDHDSWNHYLMLRFILAHTPWNATSHSEQWWSDNA